MLNISRKTRNLVANILMVLLLLINCLAFCSRYPIFSIVDFSFLKPVSLRLHIIGLFFILYFVLRLMWEIANNKNQTTEKKPFPLDIIFVEFIVVIFQVLIIIKQLIRFAG